MWSDKETDRDCLGYQSYVTVLAEVSTHKDLAPLTLGVFGSWGSGKSSLMEMLKKRIDSAAGTGTKTLWLNAWRYEGRDEAQSALINAIITALEDELSAVEGLKELGRKLRDSASVLKLGKFIMKSALTLTPDVGGFVDCFSDEAEKLSKTMEGFESDFRELLKKAKVDRIVVFVDDLDRCSGPKVIETFETIKLFLNTPSCTFVVGADPKTIEQAVGHVYGEQDERRRRDYLEKIVQIPFQIPEQGLKDITCYVGMLVIGRHLDAAGWQQLIAARPGFLASKGPELVDAIRRWPGENRPLIGTGFDEIKDELEAILPHINTLARGLRGNPRQIKRFLNILAVRRRLARENGLEVKPAELVKLAVLEYAWKDFFPLLVESVDPTTGLSPLIEDLEKEGHEIGSGEAAATRSAESGLIDYLIAEPLLSKVNLSPYLFRAQTSLGAGQIAPLAPVDVEAKALVQGIEAADLMVSRLAAKKAAAQDADVASAVVRQLLKDLSASSETQLRTRIISGLETVCLNHKSHFAASAKTVGALDPSGPGKEAIALVASSFLEKAAQAGTAVSAEVVEKFSAASKLKLSGKSGARAKRGS